MRILKVTQSYYPFLDRGGPTVKVRALARGMAAAGHQVTVLSADQGFVAATRKTVNAATSRWGFEAHEDGVEAVYLHTRARYRALTWTPGGERMPPSCPALRGRTHGHVPTYRSKHLDETQLPYVSWRSYASRREPPDCDRGTGTPRVDERWDSGPADCRSSERN